MGRTSMDLSRSRVQGDVNEWLSRWAKESPRRNVRVRAEKVGGQMIPEPPATLFQEQLSAAEIRALIKIKGWTHVDLASHWEMTPTNLSRLIGNSSRPRYVDDMVWGLAPYREKQPDGWRRRLMELAVDVMRWAELVDRIHPAPKATSFIKKGGKFVGHLVDEPRKGRERSSGDD